MERVQSCCAAEVQPRSGRGGGRRSRGGGGFGAGGVGVEGAGPPLIHVIYEPSHHADETFQRAVALGVRSHHWRFGNMPPVKGLTRGDVAMVITYIREIQRANGIN